MRWRRFQEGWWVVESAQTSGAAERGRCWLLRAGEVGSSRTEEDLQSSQRSLRVRQGTSKAQLSRGSPGDLPGCGWHPIFLMRRAGGWESSPRCYGEEDQREGILRAAVFPLVVPGLVFRCLRLLVGGDDCLRDRVQRLQRRPYSSGSDRVTRKPATQNIRFLFNSLFNAIKPVSYEHESPDGARRWWCYLAARETVSKGVAGLRIGNVVGLTPVSSAKISATTLSRNPELSGKNDE